MLREEINSLRCELRRSRLPDASPATESFSYQLDGVDKDTGNVGPSMKTIAFDTFTTLVQRKIKEVSGDICKLWDRAEANEMNVSRGTMAATLQQDIQGPSALDRVPAFTKLRRLHEGRCTVCQEFKQTPGLFDPHRSPACRVKSAILLSRDLIVLSMLQDHTNLTLSYLKKVYNSMGEGGTPWHILCDGDRSVLTQSFVKILDLGSLTLKEFGEKILEPHMCGPNTSDEEVEQLYLLYADCSAVHPYFAGVRKSKRLRREQMHNSTETQGVAVGTDHPTEGTAVGADRPTAFPMTAEPSACGSTDPMRIWMSV